jgi:hypothetical protein
MVCISTPELSDGQLLAYIESELNSEIKSEINGEIDPTITEHLARCGYCRERHRELAHFHRQLAVLLYRVDCPPSLELGEYQLGLLATERQTFVVEHLKSCPHCQTELQQLAGYLTTVAPTLPADGRSIRNTIATTVTTTVRRAIARLVDATKDALSLGRLTPSMAPAMAAVRGQIDAPLIYEADGLQIVLVLQPEGRQGEYQNDQQLLLGLLLGAAEPLTMQVQLWQGQTLLTTTAVDEGGNFVLAELAAGSYTLLLTAPDLEIELPPLTV